MNKCTHRPYNHINEKSDARLFPPIVERQIERLRRLLDRDTANKWAIGDLLLSLKNRGVKIKALADRLGYAKNRLSEIHQTARIYPLGLRRLEVPFSIHEAARAAVRRLDIEPVRALAEAIRHGLHRRRDVIRHFAIRHAESENRRVARSGPLRAAQHGDLVNVCHNGDYRQLAPTVADGSIKLFWADPPYGDYKMYADGTHRGTGLARRECDNATPAAAMAVTLDLFHLLLPKLAKGGALLLWQPGGCGDRPEITTEAKNNGWQLAHAVTWDKSRQKLAGRTDPFTSRTERLLVFKRAGERLINHDRSDASDIIRIPGPSYRAARGHIFHLFEKPQAVSDFLIKKFTYEGEIIWDVFGGTGNACVSAQRLGRLWIYTESHSKSFDVGRQRIQSHAQVSLAKPA